MTQRAVLVHVPRCRRRRRRCEGIGESFGDAVGHFVDRARDNVVLVVVVVVVIVIVIVVVTVVVIAVVVVIVIVASMRVTTVRVRMRGCKQKVRKHEILTCKDSHVHFEGIRTKWKKKIAGVLFRNF